MPIPVPVTDPVAPRQLLRDVVRQRIRVAILDGTLLPGERLNDDELISWLGVSRTPIREALAELALAGLVEMEPNRYTRVSLPSVLEVETALQTLGVLFGGTVRLAVPLLTAAQKKTVTKLIEAATTALADDDVAALNYAFVRLFDTYTEHCGNDLLIGVCRKTMDGLAFKLRVPELRSVLDLSDYPALLAELRDATLAGDGIAAELATEAMHHLPR